MPTIDINDVQLHYEVQGSGDPLFLVHGSWGDHTVWEAVAPLLADRFHVVSYDRRSHSRSAHPEGERTRRQDEDDLAGLIAALADGPAYVVGNSFGGLVTLGVAARYPELVRAAAIHEPPGISVAEGGDLEQHVLAAAALIPTICAELEAGAVERGTRRFMEEVALGPGSWELMPEEMRATLMGNATAFVAEHRDPDAVVVDVEGVRRFDRPLLLTTGDQAPVWLQMIAERLAELFPEAYTATIGGAGHIPHATHPAEYADLLAAFFARQAAIAA
jgi:pimeloyl-ACP methyl ester carboxylesterase